jgi:hypothetical protein
MSAWLDRIRSVWRPESFHYGHLLARDRRADVFEGWYLKLVDAVGSHPYALIPGVFLGEDRHAFVQLLDGARGEAWYHRYPLSDFTAAGDRFDTRVGGSRFSPAGVELRLDPKSAGGGPVVEGRIEFGRWQPWPVRALSPGVMGPYGFTPFMQCYHGILSLDHTLAGTLVIDGEPRRFDGGRGYVEKDWGRGFPLAYVWTQSNHFEREGVCVTASVARIPWVTGAFRGFIVGLLLDGELHRFTTYAGARIDALSVSDSHFHLRLSNRTHRLELDSRKAPGAVLMAPYERRMLERVAETMTSEIELRLLAREADGERLVFEGTGRHACLEAQGDLDQILDR